MRPRPEERKLEELSSVDSAADRVVQSEAIKHFLSDKHFRVVAKAATLAGIAPLECLPLVATYLSGENEGVRDFAALALGESRNPKAVEYLRTGWDAAVEALAVYERNTKLKERIQQALTQRKGTRKGTRKGK
jgi:HEAT repeat protein